MVPVPTHQRGIQPCMRNGTRPLHIVVMEIRQELFHLQQSPREQKEIQPSRMPAPWLERATPLLAGTHKLMALERIMHQV